MTVTREMVLAVADWLEKLDGGTLTAQAERMRTEARMAFGWELPLGAECPAVSVPIDNDPHAFAQGVERGYYVFRNGKALGKP